MNKVKIKIEFFGTAKLIAKRNHIYICIEKNIKEKDLVETIATAIPEFVDTIIEKNTCELKKSYNFGINGIKNTSKQSFSLKNNDSILIFSSQSGG